MTGRPAPFVMMGIVNFAVLGAALWVRRDSVSGVLHATAVARASRNAD